jgi:hypothetical protein
VVVRVGAVVSDGGAAGSGPPGLPAPGG